MLTICLGKSTYARCGIIVNVTPFEPEWEGYVTLEFSNTTPLPAKIYANEGVAQVIFFESDEVCETSYKDRGGKYQGQKGVTLPKIWTGPPPLAVTAIARCSENAAARLEASRRSRSSRFARSAAMALWFSASAVVPALVAEFRSRRISRRRR